MPDHYKNLFIHIKSSYDIAVLKSIRHLENVIKKICRSKEHLTFLHRCKDNRIIPKCLKVKSLVKTKEGNNIAKHCQYKFLLAAISEHHNRIPFFEHLILQMQEHLSNILDNDIYSTLMNHLQIIKIHTLNNTRRLLIKKFKNLKEDGKDRDMLHYQFNKDSWVINQSSRTLNKSEVELLSKGLNFATTDKKIKCCNFIAPIEDAISFLPIEEAEQIRQEVSQVLKYHKTSPDNLSSEERCIIKSLKNDESICILPADKGKATVILNKLDYHKKMMQLLNDDSTYEKLPFDPTPTTQQRMNDMLLGLKKAKKMDEKTYFYLHCSSSIIPRIYGVPKIHKEGTPLRPIVAYYTSPTYNLAKHLNFLLAPYGKNDYTIKTSVEFVKRILPIRMRDDENMVSFDVVSLFTCIPTKIACEEIELKLKNDTFLKDRTKLKSEDIIRLLNLCLNSNSIVYDNEVYKQKFGTAMGSPISPLIANCVMSKIEITALDSFHPQPTFWGRYIDDTFCILKKVDNYRFLDHLNSMNPHIKFTMEIEESRNLHFLDVLVSHNNGKFTTSVYRKETNTDQYLNYMSNHPESHKASSIKTLFKRSRDINSSKKGRIEENQKLTQIFHGNNYPTFFIKKNSDITNAKKLINKPNKYACIPFIDGTSQAIKRILGKHNIGTSFKPGRSLQSILGNQKCKIAQTDMSNVVYSIPCKDCPQKYVGQTSKQLKNRIAEHKRNVVKGDIGTSAVADHAHGLLHQIDWSGTTTIHQNSSLKQRLLLESWEYNRCQTFQKNKTQKLPDIYKGLAKHDFNLNNKL